MISEISKMKKVEVDKVIAEQFTDEWKERKLREISLAYGEFMDRREQLKKQVLK